MTREQAVKWLKDLTRDVPMSQYEDALDMAIQALQADGDAVSKANVLDIYAELYDVFDDNKAIIKEIHKVYDKLNDLPTVAIPNKVGHWIPMGLVDYNDNRNYKCSECHHSDIHAKDQVVPFCWYCGAKMGVSE